MQHRNRKKIYFVLDISQKTIKIFALKGEKGVSFGKIHNTQKSLPEFFDQVPVKTETITVALETGTHSAWISRLLEERGYEVIVAHVCDLAFIYKGDKKSDRIDAGNWHEQREFFGMNDQQQLVTPPRRRGVRMLKEK